MPTKKERLSVIVEPKLKETLQQYMIENKIWSHSAAIAAILEEYFNKKQNL